MRKKGQFFIFTAVVIVAVIFSLALGINTVKSSNKYSNLENQVQDLDLEISNVIALAMVENTPKSTVHEKLDNLITRTAEEYWASSNSYIEVRSNNRPNCFSGVDDYEFKKSYSGISVGPNFITTSEGQALRAEKIIELSATNKCMYILVMIEDKDDIYVAIE